MAYDLEGMLLIIGNTSYKLITWSLILIAVMRTILDNETTLEEKFLLGLLVG